MVYYAITIFLSAFLLFQIQPLISKRILPWFGGGPTVWTTCMLFFQVALLLGYFYAHVVGTRLRLKWQVVVHGVLMASALVVLPMIYASDAWKPETPEHPTWRIILLLSATVGLPYFVLATTSPLLQKWLTLSREGGTVYRLYALSNAGSLLALITYPTVIEPALTGKSQAYVWSAGFGLFVLLCGYSAFLAWKARNAEAMPAAQPRSGGVSQAGERPGVFQWVMWLLLAAFASTMLLAVTNQMCLDVAVVPFLWVLPLGLYLLSFIICFDSQRWYYRPVFWPVMIAMCGLMTWLLFQGTHANILTQIGVLSLGLFACCMVCHGELVRMRPHPRYLTAFYLMVSAGGALGGVFVTLIAPHIFQSYAELSIGIAGSFGAGATAFLYDMWRRSKKGKVSYGAVAVIGFVALSGSLITLATLLHEGDVSIDRNFYGILRVVERLPRVPELHKFELVHGRVYHGWQFTGKDLRDIPTSYYGEKSGVGLTLRHYPRQSGMRVGIMGLGVGTLAAYGQSGDHYTFYEINPAVVKLAKNEKWFTYLADSEAKWEIVLGDGRLMMERQVLEGSAHQFDVLVLDAFTGDAVPVHTLTCEAFEIYLRLLKPQGVIAVNITNRHLDLRPVIQGVAKHFNLKTLTIVSKGTFGILTAPEERITAPAQWVLVSADEQFLSQEALQQAAAKGEETRSFTWTDDFSNLFRVIK